MSKPADLELAEGHAVFRPVGERTLAEAVAQITEAIRFCYEQQVSRVLIDTTIITGFKPPTVSDRYDIIVQWALAAGGVVKAALVLQPDLIDPQRFGVIVGQNRGFHANVFSTEAEALAWLLDQP